MSNDFAIEMKHRFASNVGANPLDVAIVGGGLGGSIAALQLGNLGLSVALIDLHAEPRPEFRAEQLVGPQTQRLAKLELLEAMTAKSRLFDEAVNGRMGRVVDRTKVDQFGVPYEAMVSAVRSRLPGNVTFVADRVAAVNNSPDLQQVTLGTGATITARLVVMATGLSSVLPRRLGIENRMISPVHSVAIGFDMALPATVPDAFEPLIYYGENTRDRMDYLALFSMHDTIRANLFCYHDKQSDWIKAFCRKPADELLAVMPGLSKLIGDFAVTSTVQVRSNDLRVAEEPARDGVVLVGDAYQTPCPAAGTGIDRLLSDVDILCSTYVPAWFASPGMDQEKIASFYADPAKQAFDAECLRIAHYRRAVSTRRSLWWTLHRKQVFFRRQMSALLAKRRRSGGPGVRSMAPTG